MAKDIIHEPVKNALIKDGWTITHDPYPIKYGDLKLSADLGAERTLAAERGSQKIVVEIKSFIGRSAMQDLKNALGQYMIYKGFLKFMASERQLYLAISDLAYEDIFSQRAIQTLMREYAVAIFVVDLATEEITQWINWKNTVN